PHHPRAFAAARERPADVLRRRAEERDPARRDPVRRLRCGGLGIPVVRVPRCDRTRPAALLDAAAHAARYRGARRGLQRSRSRTRGHQRPPYPHADVRDRCRLCRCRRGTGRAPAVGDTDAGGAVQHHRVRGRGARRHGQRGGRARGRSADRAGRAAHHDLPRRSELPARRVRGVRARAVPPAARIVREANMTDTATTGAAGATRATAAQAGTAPPLRPQNRQLLILAVLVLLAIPLPLILPPAQGAVAVRILIFLIMAVGWNIMSGFGGLFSFGHAAYFGLGAYTSAYLLVEHGVSPWVGMAAGMAVAAAVAMVIGYFSFRYNLKGAYFALATFAFAEMLRLVTTSTDAVNGAVGYQVPLIQGSSVW